MMVYVTPLIFLIVILFGIFKKVKPYDSFVQGAKGGIPFAVSIFPYLVAIFILTELFEVSGITNFISKVLSPFFNFLGIPTELSKLVLIKPFSGSGALATLNDIYLTYGVDSYISRCASVIYGSSETVFYIATVYFAGSKTKKLTTPIVISLIASFISYVFACLICLIM